MCLPQGRKELPVLQNVNALQYERARIVRYGQAKPIDSLNRPAGRDHSVAPVGLNVETAQSAGGCVG